MLSCLSATVYIPPIIAQANIKMLNALLILELPVKSSFEEVSNIRVNVKNINTSLMLSENCII
ncbi:hypothetical protein HMPREF0216_03345 [Clostridium celatum DSM 1785]|uniref:Uncharacterized protein n=1 Tax=Clostridium celatum DSM 1785 TaxID=545697 RepID=L1Q3C6_9CLOT|nr:hypothetical protein HMPREF0216_03345 [Clostridium celatum DSM 1785]